MRVERWKGQFVVSFTRRIERAGIVLERRSSYYLLDLILVCSARGPVHVLQSYVFV